MIQFQTRVKPAIVLRSFVNACFFERIKIFTREICVPDMCAMPLEITVSAGDELDLDPLFYPTMVGGGEECESAGADQAILWDPETCKLRIYGGASWTVAQVNEFEFGDTDAWADASDYKGDGKADMG